MYLITDAKDVRPEYIMTLAPVKNTVMEQSNFIRLLYSDAVVSLSGLHVRARLYASKVEQYFNKYKCVVDLEKSAAGIKELVALEKLVLAQACLRDKKPVQKIAEQLRMGTFKLFSDETDALDGSRRGIYILKISGIWVTESEYGVTYKFMELRSR